MASLPSVASPTRPNGTARRGLGASSHRRGVRALVGAAAGVALLACQTAPAPTATPTSAPRPAAAASTPVAPPVGAAVTITLPAAGSVVPAGDTKVAFEVAGARLVPAAEARKPDDLHVHVFLDVDPAPYVGTTTPIPVGNPNIVHTAAKEVTFKDVKPGEHKLAVVMTSPDHVSLRAPVTTTAIFTAR